MKTTANATGYGINAEYVRHEGREPVPVDVHSNVNFRTTTTTPEDPGERCFPPLAACITGAARLMLALLQRDVHDAGGSYVFCDTDSMAIVADTTGGMHLCPGGPHHLGDGTDAVLALSRERVVAIVERFSALNPYDRSVVPGSVLKVEKENYDEQGAWRGLRCWMISSKRYVLFHYDDRGEPVIIRVADEPLDLDLADDTTDEPSLVKVSEHGLGHLLNPGHPDDPSRVWITEAWTWLLRTELGLPASEPYWLDRMALSRVAVSNAAMLDWFTTINDGRTYAEQVKPPNFMLVAHPAPFDESGASPIAPYEKDPARWSALTWIDRRTGQPIRVTTDRDDGNQRSGTARVRTYRDILTAYLHHPETKSLAPDGRPVSRNTRGLLRVRPVRGERPAHYIGKEANRLDDRIHGIVDGTDDYLNEYSDPIDHVWTDLAAPILDEIPRGELATRAGLDRGTVRRQLSHGAQPHPGNRQRLIDIAVQHAAGQLQARGLDVPRDPVAIMRRYLMAPRTRP